MEGHILQADGIQLKTGSRMLLSNIYLQVRTGQVLGLVGRNGMGKTSLLQVIYGSRSASISSVRLDGKRVKKAYTCPHMLTYLPSFHFIPGKFTLKRIWKDFKLDFEEILTDFPELKAFYLRPMNSLSSGERRLVEVCQIIMTPSWFSLLDEPYAQLMPLHIERISDLIEKRKVQKGFIISDHAYAYLQKLSDNITLLYNGRTIPISQEDELMEWGFLPE